MKKNDKKEPPNCERKLVLLGGQRVLKFSCGGCQSGASIEKSEKCMRGVLKALADEPDVNAVVLSDLYEREYRGAGLEALKELARVERESSNWGLANLTPKDCIRCELPRKTRLSKILMELGGNPWSAVRKLKEFRYEILVRGRRGAKKCAKCRSEFLKLNLVPLISKLDSSPLVQKDGQNLLQPLVRPCFLSSRLQLDVPDGCEIMDSYEVDGSEVKIHRVSGRLENLYFLIPPEYHLPHDKVELMQKARERMLDDLPDFDPDPLRAREQVERRLQDIMGRLAVDGRAKISRDDVGWLAKYLARFTAGLGLLEILLADPKVQDVYADAPIGRTPIHIYHRDHEECVTNIYLTPDDSESLISKFRAISGRSFSEADPVLDLNLGGARVAVVGQPLSPSGPALAIRRHKPTPWTLPQFVKAGFLNSSAAGLLSLLVDAQSSILVTGSRGAGKSSLLGALMLELLPKFRIITVEDTLELPVDQLRKLGFKIQALRVQSATSTGSPELGAADALRAALRLGESVLVIGEVRGEEAKTLYEAMRVGAAGNSVMGTIHGATARDVFERVVHDLGVHPSSFKATDVIVVAAPVRIKGGVGRVRRLLQITETKKNWRADPTAEDGFTDLMYYNYRLGELASGRTLRGGSSELIKNIARKWGTSTWDILSNISFRAKLCGTLVEAANRLKRPDLLEAGFTVMSNIAWHGLLEVKIENNGLDYKSVYGDWRKWLKQAVREGGNVGAAE
ncbi:MAG: type II/IV secretion system ATPase subunit [Candidatus Hadarchaeota archaeon]